MIRYNEIEKLALERYNELQNIIKEKERTLHNAPDGILRVAKCRNTNQYFLRTNKNEKNGQYIKASNKRMAVRLAQKEYDSKVLDAAKREYGSLGRLLNVYGGNTVDDIAGKLSYGKEELIKPIMQSDEDYIAEWLTQEYEQPDYYNEGKIFDNGHGIKMRSKSEVIISNILDEYGVPYLYEKPLWFNEYNKVLPDFTVLNVRKRQTRYWEHLGMVDDIEYFMKNAKKIADYENNGLLLGRDLIITYETKDKPLDPIQVRRVVECFLE